MRPIKFRGCFPGGGMTAYGDLIHTKRGVFIFTESGGRMVVEPDSVAQLVGYDKNGKEVYEGDTVIDEYVEGKSCEHVARLEPMTQVPETAEFYFFPYPAPFTTLKENNQ